LRSGVASPAADPRKQVAVFTNAAGRFGADGLAPGRWTIRMESATAPLLFTLDIPAGTEGLFKAGSLSPSGAQARKE
jgi:outer membrane usher protein